MEAMLFNFENNYDDDRYFLYDHLEHEYWTYVAKTPMTTKERRALRKWVRMGHSVYECPESRYLGMPTYPIPFIDMYRMDEEFRKEMKGMDPKARYRYMAKATGWCSPDEGEVSEDEIVLKNSEDSESIKMKREMYYLWEFLSTEGIQEEAREYLSEHMDQKSPFELT